MTFASINIIHKHWFFFSFYHDFIQNITLGSFLGKHVANAFVYNDSTCAVGCYLDIQIHFFYIFIIPLYASVNMFDSNICLAKILYGGWTRSCKLINTSIFLQCKQDSSTFFKLDGHEKDKDIIEADDEEHELFLDFHIPVWLFY